MIYINKNCITKRHNRVTKRHPRLVIFMLDQSAYGAVDGARGKSLAEIAAEFVNTSITEMIIRATRMIGEDEEEVKDDFRVCILGYGGESCNKVSLLYDDWISNIATNFPIEVTDTYEGRLSILRIINPVVGYDSPMAFAFEEAYKHIIKWKKYYNNELDVSPLIINVTHSMTYEHEAGNYKEDILMSAHKIMNISFPDGPPLICNVITREIAKNEEENIHSALLSISSNLTNDYMQRHFFACEKLLLNVNYDHVSGIISSIYYEL